MPPGHVLAHRAGGNLVVADGAHHPAPGAVQRAFRQRRSRTSSTTPNSQDVEQLDHNGRGGDRIRAPICSPGHEIRIDLQIHLIGHRPGAWQDDRGSSRRAPANLRFSAPPRRFRQCPAWQSPDNPTRRPKGDLADDPGRSRRNQRAHRPGQQRASQDRRCCPQLAGLIASTATTPGSRISAVDEKAADHDNAPWQGCARVPASCASIELHRSPAIAATPRNRPSSDARPARGPALGHRVGRDQHHRQPAQARQSP